ncbi:hypothetical protein ACFX2I_037559 [Malus domestica]
MTLTLRSSTSFVNLKDQCYDKYMRASLEASAEALGKKWTP